MLKEKIQLKLNRRKKYEELNKALKDSGESQISLTDKDARALMLANNISGIGFNIQAAADAKNKLLIHSHIVCKDSGICTYSSPMPSTTPYDNCLSIR